MTVRKISTWKHVSDCAKQHFRNLIDPLHDPDKPHPKIAVEIDKYRVNHHQMRSNYMLKLHERANWQGTDPIMIEFANKFFHRLSKTNIPMYVHTAYRSPELQKKLRVNGYSTLDSGPHQRGAALDIVHAHYHWQCSDAFWFYIGGIGEDIIRANKMPIVWGGRFKTLFDPAHWQVDGWARMPTIETRDDVKRSPYASVYNVARSVVEADND
jgi:hypothetical protein